MMGRVYDLINKIKVGEIKNIIVLAGAGLSTASGIPDFRSLGGLYDTLPVDALTASEVQKKRLRVEPTLVVDIELFSKNQFPYLEVRRPFILGTKEKRWKMTIGHIFLELLHKHDVLKRLYIQNIDGIEHHSLIDPVKIINVHGTLNKVSCEYCDTEHDTDEFCSLVETNIKNIYGDLGIPGPTSSTNILCKKCRKPAVKPKTVLFGRNLPSEYFNAIKEDFTDSNDCDLIIAIGTSLSVFPAANICQMGRKDVPRLVINSQVVGAELGLDFEQRDAIFTGLCDEVCLEIIKKLNWQDELRARSSAMCASSQKMVEMM